MTLVVVLAAAVTAGMLAIVRGREIYRRDGHWAFLVTRTPWRDSGLKDADLDRLPPAARRWLGWAIGDTAPLRPVAVIASTRQSRVALGSVLSCRLVLAFPHGAVWRLRWRRNGLPAALSLSTDPSSAKGTVWHAGLVPGWRAGGVASHAMLAAQCAAEAALWTPAAFLCPPGPAMEEAGPSRVVLAWKTDDHDLRMEIDIAPDGEPSRLFVQAGSTVLTAIPSGFEVREGSRVARAIVFETPPGNEPPPFSSARLEGLRPVGPFIGHSHV